MIFEQPLALFGEEGI